MTSHIDGQSAIYIDGQTTSHIDGQTARQINGQIARQVDSFTELDMLVRQLEIQIVRHLQSQTKITYYEDGQMVRQVKITQKEVNSYFLFVQKI